MKKLVVSCAAILSLVACSNEKDLFDSSAIEQKQKAEYSMQFEKQYGKISSNKTWDFTDFSASMTRAASTGTHATLVDGLNFDLNYRVVSNRLQTTMNARSMNKSLYDAIKTFLPDGQQHTGVPVVLTAPSNSFTIYPVSVQGAWTHDLYVKVGDAAPVKVYSKNWTDYSHGFVNGEGLKGVYTLVGFYLTQYTDMPGLRIEAPVGTPIEIYLANVKDGKNSKPTVGTFNGQAIYVETTAKPEGVDMHENAIVKYIGIEDNNGNGSDHDYNDVVLAIVGNPEVPEEIKVTDDEYAVTSNVTKRYMIEDLGSIGDFDFNDIVVDVTETTTSTYKRTMTNGVVTANELIGTEKKQKAVLRHLGGVLPFQLTIGSTELPERQGILDKDLEEEYDIEGWDPYANNISVKVKQKDNESVFVIPFPKAGEAPMIIATSETWQWMPEKQSVPKDWFYTDF